MNNDQEWEQFLQKLQKDKNPLYELLNQTELDIGENLIIYHPTEEGKIKLEKQRGKIQAKLVRMYPHWQSKKLMVKAGERSLDLDNHKLTQMTSPLQALDHINIPKTEKNLQPVLEEVKLAEDTCSSIYAHLTERTKTFQKICGNHLKASQ